ncbi:MAG: flagellar biosynthesis protein FlhF [Deltaproteobacteria bacterium]|nr:flagellar biosynthesis protein FlhF [Deltaproteobacteria bacterium]
MNIKRFIARNTQEAIQMVKKEMGRDAVILRTKTLNRSDKKTGQSNNRVEVTAAVDYEAPTVKHPSDQQAEMQSLLEKWKDIERELRLIKEAVFSADASVSLGPELLYSNQNMSNRYTHFKTFGLRPEIIKNLLSHYSEIREDGPKTNSMILMDALSQVLSRIKFNGKGPSSNGKRIYAFIGPTGVGKTTTLAKIAAMGAVKEGKKAALITVDTFRIGAVAQLQTYARIMDVPSEVVSNSTDLQRAINKFSDCDHILIDTSGRSPNQDHDIDELKRLLGVQDDIHHYLVLSSTTRYQDLLYADQRFGALPFKSYIFTKLDEARDASAMVNFLMTHQKPVSYFTTGQRVPEDIEVASRKKLASHILAGMRAGSENGINEVNRYGSGCWA